MNKNSYLRQSSSMPTSSIQKFILYSSLIVLTTLLGLSYAQTPDCNGVKTFELITGYVFTSPTETMTMLPGTLQLTDCIDHCQRNESCQAINFETGLCVLLTSSASSYPSALTPSQFPVFTIYAQKVCLAGVDGVCNRAWSFERVIGYELRRFQKKSVVVSSREECMVKCITENEFDCRSANYDNATNACGMSDMDRHTISPSGNTGIQFSDKYFAPAGSGTGDYLENNCVEDPKKMCDFKAIKGRILKTVDSVYQDVKTVDKCKEKCLNSPYRCFSFDFGDPSNSVCRTSHLDRSSLTHIENPYLGIKEAVTYELSSCYNVTIICRAREMIAKVKTSKLFHGKVYAKSKPNSCVNDVRNSLEFEIQMPYHDLMCDVKQQNAGKFSNDIIIQHHDMIVTTQDLGLSVHCHYDLSNRSISNVAIEVDGDVENREDAEHRVHSATVNAPNVTMRITDRDGSEIQAAQVGDPLSLRFEIAEATSPYEIFVRELIAVDGVDNSEIMLIDSQGCPTDATIMGPMSRVDGNGQVLEALFDAFKFPTSDMVQFRALVSPCLPTCAPVTCDVKGYDGIRKEMYSFGRRKRRAVTNGANPLEEEMVVVQSIKIMDSFGLQQQKEAKRREENQENVEELEAIHENMKHVRENESCSSFLGLLLACSLFLMAQLFLIFAWALLWYKRQKQQTKLATITSYANFIPPFSHYHQKFAAPRKSMDIYSTMKNQLD